MKTQTQRSLLLCFLISIAACGAVGIYCLVQGDIGSLEGRILGSTALIGAASILGLIDMVAWEQRRWHPLGMCGVFAAAIALLLALMVIWSRTIGLPFNAESKEFVKCVGIAWVLAVAIPHISLLSFARLNRSYGWARRWTIVAIAALAGIIALLILNEPGYWEQDLYMRLVGILAIADVCGTIAMPILHRVSTIRSGEAVRTVELKLSITCPRCELTQSLSVGRSSCAQCGLRFVIDIEEENCEKCGYPLYKLESAACPECGTPIAGKSGAMS